MIYNLPEIVWLFFIYSFAGWCIEVCSAAIRRRKFVNRGFVNSPLCPIYGFGAALFAIFLPELTANPFFLFLGGMVISTVLEYCTGLILEKIFHRKLWDYSHIRFNIGGYVCLRYSLLWGLLALLTMLVLNPLLCTLVDFIPGIVSTVILWILSAMLFTDFLMTAVSVLGMKIRAKRLKQFTEDMQETSRFLENTLTKWVQSRMQKSFPAIDTVAVASDTVKKNDVFAPGCGFYKLVSLFFIGAFLGDIIETIFCLITTGVLMSRSSVVYGPFSIVWGIGCAVLSALLYRYRNKSDAFIFTAGTVLGGAYEYICSVFTELVFGTIFWDYSGFTFNLCGRINLLYCFFWGIAAVVWLKFIYPFLSRMIEKIPKRLGIIVTNILIVFMIFNVIISSAALARYTERNTAAVETSAAAQSDNPDGAGLPDTDTVQGASVQNPEASPVKDAINSFLDEHFPNERMERIYPNAKIVDLME